VDDFVLRSRSALLAAATDTPITVATSTNVATTANEMMRFRGNYCCCCGCCCCSWFVVSSFRYCGNVCFRCGNFVSSIGRWLVASRECLWCSSSAVQCFRLNCGSTVTYRVIGSHSWVLECFQPCPTKLTDEAPSLRAVNRDRLFVQGPVGAVPSCRNQFRRSTAGPCCAVV
jgi:hypothetical protein